MAEENDTARDQQFDKRIIERNIEKGIVSREEYEEHLESLADTEENAAAIEAEFEEGVLDEDEEEGEEGEEAEAEEAEEDDDE